MNLYQNPKNQLFHLFSSDAVDFRVLSPDWPHPFLIMPTPKNFNHLFICMSLNQHAKNQFILSVNSSDTVIFRVKRLDWSHSLLTMPNQNIFDQLLILVTLHQHAKNEAICSLINLFWRNSWFKNPAIWLAESILAYISRIKFFPNIRFVQEHSK